ncbi:PPPDE putative peptidase domain-containing protein [Vararia minispora EC-137]|uniref:PPPDE putative peptidase domain-containing protein n=1 Tax=Vararia minispora EC-137 TaxID=1314806 RepID=A0ACB8QBJ5_9AGAM|nr:PPPDE putative peptidase domain-containing protein [Vararia minispora EC-137]
MAPVKLYVYDLSGGLAAQLSRQLTGRQIDGVWHTSIVVFGKEIFYGQGIMVTPPGRSHHGQPLRIVDMGETALDEETFQEYLTEMHQYYTADKYHLLDFNCNSFTNDVVGFLTGGSIPDWIKDLPSDFLSTPFGAALRPTIDAMYRRPVATSPSAPTSLSSAPAASQLASTLLQAVSARAVGAPSAASTASGTSTPSTATLAAPIHISTNSASFKSTLSAHRVSVVFFTSATCGPCRMIEPVFENLAREKTKGEGRIAFIKVDLGIGMSGAIANEYEVRATPTFIFFLGSQKKAELKGVNAPELKTQIDLLLYEAFPPHKHTSLSLPSTEAISLKPILFTQAPALDTVREKLFSFIISSSIRDKDRIKTSISETIIPWLKARFAKDGSLNPTPPSQVFAQVATAIVQDLPVDSLFPFLDLWRLGVLDAQIASSSQQALVDLLVRLNTSGTSASRATLLTLLRLLSNALGGSLARPLLAVDRAAATGVLVQTLLHADRLVRVAAASAAFNVAAWVQRGRVARVRGETQVGLDGAAESDEDGDWEVELVSAVVEAIGSEKESEDVYHRLVATLAFLTRLSPNFDSHVAPLLEVLQARETVQRKALGKGGLKVEKADVKTLGVEVADKLCA